MLELEVEPGTTGLVDALRWIRAFVEAEALDERPAYGVSLVAEEILTNIVKYGSPRGAIRVRLERDGAEVAVRFEDDGRAFDPTEPREPASPLLDGGRGLVLVRRHARSLAYRREGHRNVLVVRV